MCTEEAVAVEMNEETKKFFENWRKLAIIDLRGKLYNLVDYVEDIIPNPDGTVTVCWKSGAKQEVWIERGVALKRFNDKINNPCFTVAGISFKFI